MFRPMLAAKLEEKLDMLRYPLLASPKLDGIRAIVRNGALLSRSMKLIPNDYVRYLFERPEMEGFDGELIVGDPTNPEAFRITTSAVMSGDGQPQVRFFAFDHAAPELWNVPYVDRLRELGESSGLVAVVPQVPVYNETDVLRVEELYLREGYEGVMLRSPDGRYKQGRSTLNEGILMKLKRFHESEAVVIGVLEQMRNLNEAKPDERGYMKRTSHLENKVPAGVLGAISVRDLKSGVEFEIGTGFTSGDREALWRQNLIGRVARYRYFPTGSKEKPRFPVFDGFRSTEDL